MRTLKTLIIGLCIVALLAIIAPVQAIPNETNIVTDYFNITFDNIHGGVVTSLQYKGIEFLTGGDNGKWGTIGLRRSTWNGSGYVCTRWAQDMIYQYDQTNHTVTVKEYSNRYKVTINVIGGMTSEILGSGKKIIWEIPKHSAMINVKYPHTSGNTDEYLYMPFIRNYNLGMSTLTYYTTAGNIILAGQTPYCESRWYQSSLADYKLTKSGNTVGTMLFVNKIAPTSAYYGNDTNTWQIHYPFLNKGKKMSMIFYG